MKFMLLFIDRRGFTLVELMVVMMIMSILLAIAVPTYQRHQVQARETVLAEDLYQMRRALDAYFSDKGQYPESLQSLVDGHYIRSLPRDPFTRSSESWECIPPEPTENGELVNGGCFDVRSSSTLIGTDGVPYREW